MDTSALVKLVVPEPESAALLAFLEGHPAHASSVIAAVELRRALLRAGIRVQDRVRAVLVSVVLIGLDVQIVEEAGQLGPPTLRSLDAIHLGSALALGTDLAVLVTYDERLAEAARTRGVEVASPS